MANINKIQLPNGTQYDIEDAVARGKSVMVVTITEEEDQQTGETTYSADKTFLEIVQAYSQGRLIFLRAYVMGYHLMPLFQISGENAFFMSVGSFGDESETVGEWCVFINNDNTVNAYSQSTKVIPSPSSSAPLADGTGAVGTSTNYARADHVHPVGSLSGLSDTTVTTPSNGQVLTYDSTTQKWVNGAAASGGTQSDWDENDSTDPAYVLNRPAIRAGEGENSIIEGQIEQDDDAVEYTLTISGEAKATTFTYTTQDTLPSAIYIKQYGVAVYVRSSTSTVYRRIESLNTTNGTIKLNDNLSTSAITNGTLTIYYAYKSASGTNSHAEGFLTSAKSNYSHAEGQATAALAVASHTEGSATAATGNSAHAEGTMTIATGVGSHTEGGFSVSKGTRSHAEGYYTIAGSTSQHVQGKYNIEDSNDTYAHIVGNGTSDNARSNAHTLDWSGNGWYAGKLTVGAGPVNNMDVATKQYVDNAAGIFWVEFTDDGASNPPVLSADKTFAEVVAAYAAGKVIKATYFGNVYDLNTALDENSTYIDFVFRQILEAGGGYEYGTVSLNNNWIQWQHENNTDSINWYVVAAYAPDMAYPSYPGPSNGQILIYNSTSGKWEAANLPSIPTASTTLPIVDGTAAIGSSSAYAKADHVHPTDTSRAPVNSPALTGTPTAPTAAAGTNTTQIATTQFVNSAVSSALTSVMTYKGTKATVAALPSSGNAVGDVWHVTANGSEYAWDGSTWQELGTSDKEVMVVYPTDINQGIYTFNKTFSEISSHLNNGGIAILLYTSSGLTNIYEVSAWDSSFIGFARSIIYSNSESGEDEVWFEESSFFIYPNNTGEYFGGVNAVISSGASLNGNYTSFPTFYAPTSAGTSGYVLTSSGSGAPTWQQPTAVPSASSTAPLADGTAAVGSSTAYARADHVHPVSSLSALSDTTVASPSNGQILVYNGTSSKWENSAIPAQNGSLSISSNVITLTNASGQTSSITLPVYNGSVSVVTGGGS